MLPLKCIRNWGIRFIGPSINTIVVLLIVVEKMLMVNFSLLFRYEEIFETGPRRHHL